MAVESSKNCMWNQRKGRIEVWDYHEISHLAFPYSQLLIGLDVELWGRDRVKGKKMS
jgi:hypothetical protein